ncbi:hypothetical protein QL285_079289 [Trifolium repens]|nr:hypothetical protein QL285_079289 [Trifolium repens]
MSIYECVRRIGLREDFVCVTIPYMPKRIYAMHFIVACLGVCLCDFAYVPGVCLCDFAKSYWILLSWWLSCVTHPVLSHRDCFGIVCATLPGVIPPIVGGVIPPETYAFYREVEFRN